MIDLFNETHHPNKLYEQSEGVTVVFPLGPLLADVSTCDEAKMHPYYRRYVDDTLTIMPDKTLANLGPWNLIENILILVLHCGK